MTRTFSLGAVTALLVLAGTPAASGAPAYPPGFQVDLADATHVECFVAARRLRCLNYTRATSPGRCDFGGDVPTAVLPRRGAKKLTHTCVDEGYHGWRRLRATGTFRSGGFTCRLRDGRTRLRCSNLTRTETMARSASGT